MTGCLFCSGDRDDPDHDLHCCGAQGEVEAREPELPILASGLTADTYATSLAAAEAVTDAATQRDQVYATICAGAPGQTDDKVQELLHLDGSSERPRRWELWKQGRIEVLVDETGEAVTRKTRKNRDAVVWVPVAAPQQASS